LHPLWLVLFVDAMTQAKMVLLFAVLTIHAMLGFAYMGSETHPNVRRDIVLGVALTPAECTPFKDCLFYLSWRQTMLGQAPALSFTLQAQLAGWIAVGFSKQGEMVISSAVSPARLVSLNSCAPFVMLRIGASF
jgi:hypothetical protein